MIETIRSSLVLKYGRATRQRRLIFDCVLPVF
jgi:hypothetical protein